MVKHLEGDSLRILPCVRKHYKRLKGTFKTHEMHDIFGWTRCLVSAACGTGWWVILITSENCHHNVSTLATTYCAIWNLNLAIVATFTVHPCAYILYGYHQWCDLQRRNPGCRYEELGGCFMNVTDALCKYHSHMNYMISL